MNVGTSQWRIGARLAFVLACAGGTARADEALRVVAVRPQEQAGRVLGLFRGARAADPSAALAAWKHANGGRASLGKPLEAVIAAFNPAMVREWNQVDGAELVVSVAPGTGRLDWRLAAPNDDGSLAAFAPALALTGGAGQEPLGAASVFRLGPTGAPLAASRPGRFALASTREGLQAALDRPDPPALDGSEPSGWQARLDPAGLRGLTSLSGRRLAEALDAVGCRAVTARLALEDETLTLRVAAALRPAPRGRATIDPAWLDAVPASGVLAAVSIALETGPERLDAAFAVLDRVERSDPARAGVAPLRVRLNLLASAARVRLESDLWLVLRGLTAVVLVDRSGDPSGVVVVLHASDPRAAGRLADTVVPRLASAFGTIVGRPSGVSARGSAVAIGWGVGALESVREAIERPEKSAGGTLRAAVGPSPFQRVGAFWTARFSRLAPSGSPLALALSDAPPVVWTGRTEDHEARDVVSWSGLRGVVRRGLDALPLDPPPDH